MAEKTVTYTAEQTATLVEGYKAGESLEMLAEQLGKSVRSVVAKLSREGVYVSKAKAAGKTRVTKAELVSQIEAATGIEPGKLVSLEKASHEALEMMVAQLVQ